MIIFKRALQKIMLLKCTVLISEKVQVDNTTWTLENIAIQSYEADKASPGDSFTFKAVLNLPHVPVMERSELRIELFGMHSIDGVAAFHICQAFMVEKGTNVEAI